MKQKGFTLPTVLLVIAVLIIGGFIYLTYNNWLIKYNVQKLEIHLAFPPKQTSSTPSITPTSIPQALSFSIPANWEKYSKVFRGLKFSFNYPPELSISDWDEDSGDIRLDSPPEDTFGLLEINRLTPYKSPKYSGGSLTNWFIQAVQAESGSSGSKISEKTYSFTLYEFTNGKKFYLITENELLNGSLPQYVEKNTDTYIGAFNNNPIIVRDSKILPKNDALRIMQSLSVE